MKKKFIKALVIGPSGIGSVHIREFLRYGITDLAFIGKSNKKKRFFNFFFEKSDQLNITNLKNTKNIKNYRPNIVSICSPANKHFKHILDCINYTNFIIVEKPFIWFKNKKKNVLKAAINLLKKTKTKIVVNLPMVSVAKQFIKKKEIPARINLLKFCYYTKGTKFYDEIPIDLLPHALSFLITILKGRKLDISRLKIRQFKTKWSCDFVIGCTVCKFRFKQNSSYKQSTLKFTINKNYYKRHLIQSKDDQINYFVKNNHKRIFIKNPMKDYISYLMGIFSAREKIKSNNNLVLQIIKIKQKLLNYNNIKN